MEQGEGSVTGAATAKGGIRSYVWGALSTRRSRCRGGIRNRRRPRKLALALLRLPSSIHPHFFDVKVLCLIGNLRIITFVVVTAAPTNFIPFLDSCYKTFTLRRSYTLVQRLPLETLQEHDTSRTRNFKNTTPPSASVDQRSPRLSQGIG